MDILLVEDDPVTRSLLKTNLQRMGHLIHEAPNGKQAVDEIKAHTIRFVITDWGMPDMDGLALCRYIRGSAWGRYIYVIVLTARDRKQDVLEVFAAGADDYVSKPFDPEELKARVQTVMRLAQQEDHYQEMQHKLVTSRNKLQIVFDSLQEQIITLDAELNIFSANQAFFGKFDLDARQMVGQPAAGFCHAQITEKAQQVAVTGLKADFLLEESDEDGSVCYHQVVCLPIRHQTGQLVHVVIVSKDITEHHRKTEEIRSLNEQLIRTADQLQAKNQTLEQTLQRLEDTQAHMLQSEKMASIGQLAAGVAHEINNPTGFVSSNLKTLSDYNADLLVLIGKYRAINQKLQAPEHLQTLDREMAAASIDILSLEKEIDIDFVLTDIVDLIGDCREGTERIKKIVSDLKDFAHPGNDQTQLVDVNRGLESTLNVVNNEIKYKATVHKSFGDIPMVPAIAQQLNQVFMNILVNAAQAIADKGEIYIATRCVADGVEVTIGDTGGGIEKKNLLKIFDPFFTTKDVGKGTGLGLHIAYNIIKKHNGSIAVTSQVGQGTLFTIKLPVAPEEEEMVL